MSARYIPKWSRKYLVEAYETMSLGQIAKANNSYSVAVLRAMEYYGIPLRNKSQAQKKSLENGTSKNPNPPKEDSP